MLWVVSFLSAAFLAVFNEEGSLQRQVSQTRSTLDDITQLNFIGFVDGHLISLVITLRK